MLSSEPNVQVCDPPPKVVRRAGATKMIVVPNVRDSLVHNYPPHFTKVANSLTSPLRGGEVNQSTSFATYNLSPTTYNSTIQHLLLMVDAFHMHCIKIFGDEFFAQPYFIAFGGCSFNNFVPTIRL
jgi:hypothetical protein